MAGWSLRPIPLAVCVAALAACDAGSDPETAAERATAPAASERGAARPSPEESHRLQVAALARIAKSTLSGEAPYFGEGPIERLRRRLAALPVEAAAVRYPLEVDLGERLLQQGEVVEAIEWHLAAERSLAALGSDAPPGEATAQDYRLAVAYLRLGEVENCTLAHNADRCLLPIRGDGVHRRKEGSRNAARHLERVLADPRAEHLRLKALWLLNVAYMTLGRYPQGVPEPHRIPERAFEAEEAFPRFHDVAPGLGLDTMSLSGGAVAEDFDGDGHLDLMVSEWHPAGQLRFFRNRGDGRFADQTEAAGLMGITGGLNLVQGDYDGDGDADVLVLRGAWLGDWGRQPNSLLRNEGDGRFLDVARHAGLSPPDCPTQTGAFADYDNDGDLDLYVGCEADGRIRAASQLFRNEGDGTFSEVAATAGVANLGYAKGVAWGDYDADGHVDLYVSNLGSPNRLYRNLGDGSFRDVAPRLGVDGPEHSFPVWFWDFDNDGALDLYVSGYKYGLENVVAGYLGIPPRVPLARLYRGDGRGGFEDVAPRQNLRRATMPMGANFGDLDNDGFLDFYLGTGYPEYEGLMPNVMYRNRHGSGFSDVTTAGGFGHLQKGHGIAFADLDNDGDQDVFAEMGGAFRGDGFMNALFENPGFGNHWLKLRLVGVRSNRDAIGARVRIDLREGGRLRSIHRHVSNGSSFGCNPLRLEVGLGKAERIEALEVTWPATGERQRFTDLGVDRAIEITEGDAAPRPLPLRAAPFALDPAPGHTGHGAHGGHEPAGGASEPRS